MNQESKKYKEGVLREDMDHEPLLGRNICVSAHRTETQLHTQKGGRTKMI